MCGHLHTHVKITQQEIRCVSSGGSYEACTTHTQWALWQSSRLSCLTFHLTHYVLFSVCLSMGHKSQNGCEKACHCCRHELAAPQLHTRRHDFGNGCCKENNSTLVVTCVVGPAGQTVLFTSGPCIKNVISLCRTLAKRKDAAAMKAHTGGTTVSTLSLSTPCPTCINSYVTMASVHNGSGSRAQQQEMTYAKRPRLWLRLRQWLKTKHRDGVTLKFKTNQTSKHNSGGNLPGCRGHQGKPIQFFCCYESVLFICLGISLFY